MYLVLQSSGAATNCLDPLPFKRESVLPKSAVQWESTMLSRRRTLQLAGLGTAATMTAPAIMRVARAVELDEVRIGTPLTISDAPILIAEHMGYCKEQGLRTTMTALQTGAYMVAPLGAGQLDIGAGATSAGLFNSAARGIGTKIVADKGSNQPGYAYVSLL